MSEVHQLERVRATIKRLGYPPDLAGALDAFEALKRRLDEIEQVAFRQHVDWMHFHEVGIDDPFKAESEAQAFAARIAGLASMFARVPYGHALVDGHQEGEEAPSSSAKEETR